MRVAVTDSTFASLDIERAILARLGCELIAGQCKSAETLIPLVRDCDVVLTQFAPISRDVVAAMNRARAIVRYGIGVDNVDLQAAREHGIPVCNVPDYCIDEVADHALALILSATRQLMRSALGVRQGNWGLPVEPAEMKALTDMTVGIVGLGRIGRGVAQRLTPFRCRQLAFDPALSSEAICGAGCEPVELVELLESSDLVTLHCPSTPQTRQLLNRGSIGRMKRGAIVVNVARGDLVETAALAEALCSGQIAAAALDVCDPEPLPSDSPLRTLDNVIVTPHVASVSAKAVRKLRETVADIAARAVRGEPLPNIVNGVRGARR